MYYLKNRYYDPELRRFISADKLSVVNVSKETLDNRNLYVYCNANPLNRNDVSGELWVTLVSAAAGAIVGGAYSIATQMIFEKEVNWVEVAGDAATGALATTSVGRVGQAIAGGVSAVIASRAKDESIGDTVCSGALAALGGIIGGPGAGYGEAYDKLYGFTHILNRIRYDTIEKVKIANRQSRIEYMEEFWKKVINTGKDYVQDFSVKTVVNYRKKIIGYARHYDGRTGESYIYPIYG